MNRSPLVSLSKQQARGFTLLELLIVIGLVAALATISTVAVGNIVASMRLLRAVDTVQNTLRLARQTSLAKSHIVEVRFFKAQSTHYQGSTPEWRAMQAVEILEDGREMPLTEVMMLPQTMIISGSEVVSTMLGEKLTYAGATTSPSLPGISDYRRFRFMPDGTTDLQNYDAAQEKWHLTIFNLLDQRDGEVPPNFATIQVEPLTGAISLYRP